MSFASGIKKCGTYRGELAQMAAWLTSDWKIPSLNPAGSNENSIQYIWSIFLCTDVTDTFEDFVEVKCYALNMHP